MGERDLLFSTGVSTLFYNHSLEKGLRQGELEAKSSSGAKREGQPAHDDEHDEHDDERMSATNAMSRAQRAQTATTRVASPRSCRGTRSSAATRRGRVVAARALNNGDGNESFVDTFIEEAKQMGQRYDFLSAAAGSAVVTSYCVMRGQCPWTALSIGATATVFAVVMNELLLDEPRQ